MFLKSGDGLKNYGTESNRNLKLWVKLNRLNVQIQRSLSRTIKSYGLSLAQFAVLEVLYHKGNLCVGNIIDKILISGGNITLVIENLRKKGLVAQRFDEKDRRKKVISITKEGAVLLEAAFQDHLDTLNQLLSIYTTEERETMIKLFDRYKQLEKRSEHIESSTRN